MNYNIKKPLISFIIAISLLIIDGCRKDFEATAEHKATYGWEMFEMKDYLQSKEWFSNSIATDKKWKDGYNGLGWSYAKLLELDSLDTENIGSIRTFHRGLTYPKDIWNNTDVHLEILAIDSTLIGLNPSRWDNWVFSHDSTLNYLDLRLTMAASYFALAKFDSTHKHLKVVLDSLGSPSLLINDYSTLLGKQKVAQQLDSLQKVLQQK